MESILEIKKRYLEREIVIQKAKIQTENWRLDKLQEELQHVEKEIKKSSEHEQQESCDISKSGR